MQAARIPPVGLPVSDLDRSVAWYREALGLTHDSTAGLRRWAVRDPDGQGAVGEEQVLYPVSELAARYGASVREQTSDPDQAYAGSDQARLERPASWDRLPWG